MIWLSIINVVIQLHYMYFCVSGTSSFTKGMDITSLKDYRVDSDLISEFDCSSKIICAAECSAIPICTSISFNKITYKCRHFAIQAGKNTYAKVFDNGWRYYLVAETWCPMKSGFRHDRVTDVCYLPVTGTRSHAASRQLCSNYGANNPIVDTQEKDQLLVDVCKNTNNVIGYFFDAYETGNAWHWGNGQRFDSSYTNWDTVVPTNIQPQYNGDFAGVLKFNYGYYWHDVDISYKLGTICEIHKT